jgi:hypothetical protein
VVLGVWRGRGDGLRQPGWQNRSGAANRRPCSAAVSWWDERPRQPSRVVRELSRLAYWRPTGVDDERASSRAVVGTAYGGVPDPRDAALGANAGGYLFAREISVTARDKRCASCHRVAPLQEFPPNPRTRDRRSSWCRTCATESTRRWRASNPDYVEAYNQARRVRHSPRSCVGCGLEFVPVRVDSRHCCSACRRHQRANSMYSPESAAWHRATYHGAEAPTVGT